MSSPAGDLIRGIVIGLKDGSLSPSEGAEVLEACADLIEELGEVHVDSWWGRLVLSAAAGAVRQAAQEVGSIPHPDNEEHE